MVKDNTYVHIEAFMVNDLHLSGNELITYAIIYGFSQDGESWFTGSRGYIAEWCHASKTTASNNLKKLVQKGLLERRERTQNGVTLVDYRAKSLEGVSKELEGGIQKTCTPPLRETCPHTIEEDTLDDIIEEKGKRKRFTPPTLQEVEDYVREKGLNVDAKRFWDYYEAMDWHDRDGKKVQRWKGKAITWDNGNKPVSPGKPARRTEPELVKLPYGMMPESLVKTDEELGRMTQFQRDCYYHNARTYQRDWEAEHGNE